MLFTQEGTLWYEQKKFWMTEMKTHGFAKATMDMIIEINVGRLQNKLLELCGKPIDIRRYIQFPILNSIWIMLAGYGNYA